MFFGSWSSLLRILLVGVPAYVALLVLLRVGGKRTLSKFNAFDLVVTVAFGSSLSAALLTQDLALLDVIAAFALLIGLQFALTWTMVRWPRTEKLIKSEPQLVFRHGDFLDRAMRRERLTKREVEAAIRAHGSSTLEEVAAVILETDGTFSVVTNTQEQATALRNVRDAG